MKNKRNLGINHLCLEKMSIIRNVQSVSVLSIVLSHSAAKVFRAAKGDIFEVMVCRTVLLIGWAELLE
jgi:hypothetical protein